ncbi:MAG: SDR family NAD(P)-dependent oxidoreductase, partial [Halocynthiibacter sp.]
MHNRALVTGAGIRLGRALALRLAEQGYDVAVHFNSSADDAKAVVAEIETLGRRACALQADLLDETATQALVGRAANALGGPLNCLVNNASIFEHDTLQSATRASWDRHVEANLRAPFVLIQNFAAQVPAAAKDENGETRAGALIVNMLDQRVKKLTPEFMSYTIAKMALWTLTRTAAQALA